MSNEETTAKEVQVQHSLVGLNATRRQRNLRRLMQPEKRQSARRMRNNPTPSEAKLWCSLRQAQLLGLRFKRQSLLRGYIADFYCAALGLVIEVDGPYHAERIASDIERDRNLVKSGIATLRVSAAAVMDDHEAVLSLIADVARRRAAALGGSIAAEHCRVGAVRQGML